MCLTLEDAVSLSISEGRSGHVKLMSVDLRRAVQPPSYFIAVTPVPSHSGQK